MERYDFPLLADHRHIGRVSLAALSKADMAAHLPLVVQIPVHALTNGREGLADVSPATRRWIGVRQIILTLAHLCANPYLCMEPEVDEQGRPVPPDYSPEKRSVYMELGFDSETGDPIVTPRAVTLVEVVRDPNGVSLAYRFYFLLQDQRMSWDRGIEALCAAAQGSAGPSHAKRGTSKPGFHVPPPTAWECFPRTREQWVSQYLAAYSRKAEARSYLAYSLTNLAHGAAMCKFLTLETCRAQCESWAPGAAKDARRDKVVRPAQLDMSAYRAPDTGEYVFPFPDDVYCLPPDFVSAVALYHARFPHLAPQVLRAPPDCPDFDPYLERRLEMARLEAMGAGPGSRERVNGFTVLRATNAERTRGMTAKQKWDWARAPETLATFAATWHAGGGLNTVRTIAQWGAEQRTLLTQLEMAQDPLLSTFANFIIDKMEAVEKVYICKNMHATLLATWVCVLTSLCPNYELKNNALLTGAAAVGKSFIMNRLYDDICIPGTILKVSHITECALKTESDFNFVTLMYDEMPNKMLGMAKDGKGVDGTGDPFLKTLMTEQRVDVVSFLQTEDGKRIADIIKNPMVVGFVGGTNAPKHLIPDALATRYWAHDCIEFPRLYHEVTQLRKAAAYQEVCDPEQTARLRNTHNNEFRKLQFLTCMVEQLIYVGMLPVVNTTVAMEVFDHAVDFFAKYGYACTKERDHTRLRNAVRVLAILHACHLVFNTTRVFDPTAPAKLAKAQAVLAGVEAEGTPEQVEQARESVRLLQKRLARSLEWFEANPGGDISTKPFEFRDVMEVAPYLICTEEMAIFAVTLFRDLFFNPDEPIPVDALARAYCQYTSKADAATTNAGAKFKALKDGKIDPNYVALEGVHVNFQQQETLESAAAKMAQSALAGDARMSVESITDVIHALARRSMQCAEVYEVGPGHAESDRPIVATTPAVAPLLKIIDFNYSTKCVYILRQYLDFVRTREYKNLMNEFVASYEHRFVRPRRVLTATTWLTGHASGVSMPQFFHVVDWEPKPDGRCMKTCRVGLGYDPTTITNVDTDLEEARAHMFLRDTCGMADSHERHQYTPRGVHLWLFAKFQGTQMGFNAYPNRYMAAYADVEKQLQEGMRAEGFTDVAIARRLSELSQGGAMELDDSALDRALAKALASFKDPTLQQEEMDLYSAYGNMPTLQNIIARQELEALGCSAPPPGVKGINDHLLKRMDPTTTDPAVLKRMRIMKEAAPPPPRLEDPYAGRADGGQARIDSGVLVRPMAEPSPAQRLADAAKPGRNHLSIGKATIVRCKARPRKKAHTAMDDEADEVMSDM